MREEGKGLLRFLKCTQICMHWGVGIYDQREEREKAEKENGLLDRGIVVKAKAKAKANLNGDKRLE